MSPGENPIIKDCCMGMREYAAREGLGYRVCLDEGKAPFLKFRSISEEDALILLEHALPVELKIEGWLVLKFCPWCGKRIKSTTPGLRSRWWWR